MIWLMPGVRLASGQADVLLQNEICHPLEDDQKLYQAYIENPLLKQEINLLKQKLEIKEEEGRIKDEYIALEKKRGDIYKEAFEAEKDLTDRSLKLAEQSKGSTREVLGILGVIAIIVTVIAAVL